jgi:hypothetical protein
LALALLLGLVAISSGFRAEEAMAQSDLASISGTVSDASGALVPKVTVTITNESTGAARVATTNKSGLYTVPGLSPGRYTITAQAPGFERLVKIGNNIDPSLPNTENLTMTVGQVMQSVQVEAQQETLQADSATLGRVITSSQVENLPLNGRNPIFAALTKAGISASSK